MTATTLDPERLRRALRLGLEPHGDGWLVNGHRVDPTHGCGCPDALYRPGTLCKHALRVRLADLDPDIMDALRALTEVNQ